MPKTSFTKVEEALAVSLERLKIEELLLQADAAVGKVPEKKVKERILTIRAIQRALNQVWRHDKELYKKLRIKRKSMENFLANAAHLNEEDWNKLVSFKTQVDEYVAKLGLSSSSDEDIVAQQRRKHITKRFNVNEKWLPLK